MTVKNGQLREHKKISSRSAEQPAKGKAPLVEPPAQNAQKRREIATLLYMGTTGTLIRVKKELMTSPELAEIVIRLSKSKIPEIRKSAKRVLADNGYLLSLEPPKLEHRERTVETETDASQDLGKTESEEKLPRYKALLEHAESYFVQKDVRSNPNNIRYLVEIIYCREMLYPDGKKEIEILDNARGVFKRLIKDNSVRARIIAVLVDMLNKDLETKLIGAAALIEAHSRKNRKAAFKVFIDALNNDEPTARNRAIGILNEISYAKTANVSCTAPALLNALVHGNRDDVWEITEILGCIVKKSNLANLVNEIVSAARNTDGETKELVLMGLEEIARKKDIEHAMPLLARALVDKNIKIVETATNALLNVANRHADIIGEIPALTVAIRDFIKQPEFCRRRLNNDFNWLTLPKILNIFQKAAKKGNRETLAAIVIAVNELVQSRWFLGETERNSRAFIELSTTCARTLEFAKRRERILETKRDRYGA